MQQPGMNQRYESGAMLQRKQEGKERRHTSVVSLRSVWKRAQSFPKGIQTGCSRVGSCSKETMFTMKTMTKLSFRT